MSTKRNILNRNHAVDVTRKAPQRREGRREDKLSLPWFRPTIGWWACGFQFRSFSASFPSLRCLPVFPTAWFRLKHGLLLLASLALPLGAEAKAKPLKIFILAEAAVWKRGASNAGYYYLGCAKTFPLMGKAFPEATLEMMRNPKPR